jgi:glycosyltransferase involved in cell wall biosynthesis
LKRVTFITTGQPTTNPRLVKEAETLLSLGYSVKVICCFYQVWSQSYDAEITGRYPGVYIYCGGDQVLQRKKYYQTRIRQRLCQLLFPYFSKNPVAENAISRTHTEALQVAKRIKTDLYIAHNLGALPAAVMAAKQSGAAVGYDAEDMHSAQYLSDKDPMYLLNKYIEEKYFEAVDYFSAASPLIAQYYQHLYPFLKPAVINNVFPRTTLKIKQNYVKGKPLKLFWFSQTIGADRGLESLIQAIGKSESNSELHLLGHCPDENKASLSAFAKKMGLNQRQISFHPPVAPDELFVFASKFDIGFAGETGSTLNRDICLTNKVFTYIQSGLAIIASDTQAQALFLRQYPATGRIFDKNDADALVRQLEHYLQDPDLLYRTRLDNYRLGQTQLNWEAERDIFLKLVENT